MMWNKNTNYTVCKKGGIRMGNYLEGLFWLLELLMKLIWILPLVFLGLGIGIGYLIWG